MQMSDVGEREAQAVENDDSDIEYTAGGIPHPPGIFRAEFVGFEKDTANADFGLRLRLKFQTEAEMENGDPFGISCWTKPSFHTRGKIRPMLTAMGEDVTRIDLKSFKLGPYVGKKLILVIEHEPRKDGQGERAVIKSFQALPKKGAAKKPNFEDDDQE